MGETANTESHQAPGTFLFGAALKSRLYGDSDGQDVLKLANDKEWKDIDRIGIFPLPKKNISSICIDLTVGAEVYKHSDGKRHSLDGKADPVMLGPGETAIVLSRENLVIPPDVGGLVLTKSRFIWDGISQGTTKIDPTWYGCLHVSLTNHTRDSVPIKYGKAFCSVMFFIVPGREERIAHPLDVRHLGQTEIEYSPNTVPWERLRPTRYDEDQFQDAVRKFGPPMDILEWRFQFEKDNVVREVSNAIREPIKRDMENLLLRELATRGEKEKDRLSAKWIAIIASIAGVIVAVVTLVAQHFLKN